MTYYARVKDGGILEYREISYPIMDQSLLHPDKPRLLPVIKENEDYDPDTQVREGPETVIEETQVRWVYTVREKTAEEIAEMKVALIRRIRREEVDRIEAAINPGKFAAMVTLGFMGMIASGSLDRATWNAQVKNSFNPIYDVARTTLIAIHTAAVTKEAEATALTTAAEIAAYDVNAGWP